MLSHHPIAPHRLDRTVKLLLINGSGEYGVLYSRRCLHLRSFAIPEPSLIQSNSQMMRTSSVCFWFSLIAMVFMINLRRPFLFVVFPVVTIGRCFPDQS